MYTPPISRTPSGPLAWLLPLAIAALAGLAAPAQALTIGSTSNPQTFTNLTVQSQDTLAAGPSVTDGTYNAGILFSRFSATTGVLTGVQINLTGSSLTSSVNATASGGTTGLVGLLRQATATGSGKADLSAPGVSTTVASLSASVSCDTADSALNSVPGCPETGAGTSSAAGATLNAPGGSLDSYAGAGTFTVSLDDASLTANAANTGSGGAVWASITSTFTMTWGGTLNTTYTYLKHANPSFLGGSNQTSLLIDFGTVAQGAGAGSLSQAFNIFNALDGFLVGERVGLNLTSIAPDGGNSPALTTSLATFGNLAAGSSQPFTAFLNTTAPGLFNSIFTIDFHDSCPATHASTTCLAGPDLTLTLKGEVALAPADDVGGETPLPPTLLMLIAGTMGLGGTYLVRRRLGLVSR